MAATLFTNVFSTSVILFTLILLLDSEAYLPVKAEANTAHHSREMEKFDEVMKLLMQRCNAPGAQLAVAKGGHIKYFRAFGIANRDSGEAMTTKHIMRYNSFSKFITGTAILKLVQEGKLALEDRPFHLLKNLEPPRGAIVDKRLFDITIQNLLQHTGGWNSTSSQIEILTIPAALYASHSLGRPSPPTAQEAIRYMKSVPLDFNPGSAMAYSNPGYMVLGRVIEKVTGMDYGQYVHQHILNPLGLTTFKLGQSQLEYLAANEVRYYGVNGEDTLDLSIFPGEGFVNRSYGLLDYRNADAAGGWTGNAADAVKFMDHIDGLRQPAVLKEDMVYAMLNAPMPSNRSFPRDSQLDHPKGLDVFVNLDNNGMVKSFHHAGGADGAHSLVMRLTQQNITFAYLLNTLPSNILEFLNFSVGNLTQVAESIKNWPGRVESIRNGRDEL